MKGAIFSVVLAAAGGLVNAQNYRRQNFAGEPSCAIPCLVAAISSAGCPLTDEGCQCNPATIAVLGGYAAPCLVTACDASDVVVAESVGLAKCSAYSLSLAAVSATTTTSAPTSSTSASTASSTSTTAASTTTSTITTTSAPATTTKSNSTPQPVSSTGGANAIVAGLGGVAGLVAAFVAAV